MANTLKKFSDGRKSVGRRLEEEYGRVWTTSQLQEDFVVHGFLAPYVVCTHKETNKKGTLMFTHMPRFYYSWKED